MTEKSEIVWCTFLVRLWKESQAAEWRGQITHLQSGETRYFVTSPQLTEFFRVHGVQLSARGE